MRYVTVAEVREIKKPGKKDGWYEHAVYRMMPGTAWKIDPYGSHQVVEVDEDLCKKIAKEDTGYCHAHFDGRNMVIFKVGEDEYMQPTADDPRATENRLGSKRAKRKARKPRRDAPGVAPQAISWENDDTALVASGSDQPGRRHRKAALQPGEVRPYRRAGGRGGLRLES